MVQTASDSPVGQGQRVAEMLDPLEMGGVARDQLQATRQGDGGNHRIGHADGLADSLQLAGDAASQLGGCLVEGDHFFRGDGCQEVFLALASWCAGSAIKRPCKPVLVTYAPGAHGPDASR